MHACRSTLEDPTYYARASASDSQGAFGPWGVIHGFTLAPNQLPPTPALAGPLGASCSGYTASTAPSSFDVSSDPDPQGDAVTLELAVFAAGADPASATPLTSASAARGGATTTIPVSASTFVAGTSYQVSVRSNDGTGRTPWSTCQLAMAAPPPPPATPSSGGCGCGTAGVGLGLEGLVGLVAALGLRRRRSRAKG